jgi:BON domain-containing protein
LLEAEESRLSHARITHFTRHLLAAFSSPVPAFATPMRRMFQENAMKRLLTLATGMAAGAFAMYMFDPENGNRRRARVRDKAVAAGHDTERLARGATKHATNQLRGAAAEAQSHMRDASPDDRQLHERIRSQLGRLVEHPGNLQVKVEHGHVTLSGSAKPSEIQSLLASVSSMQGVERVDNRLSAGTGAQPPSGGVPLH